ncbi:LysM peptidoglycan-binding domain-containing protein [Brochothrix thermosphacta]|uniref:LysM peptidoglycan-binding domain-containing protein n=1 Tax=Brochothrix thermosphacta TaxID=2756 RepID=UPI00265CD494|nr:LysM peptidoglycan-binding domain-containing protein [Brochothrix thermosphacta]WKK68546.1 LysM peptidoglycan-binding domain-containing protein [Brochothrix thermosphacta]
MKKLTLSLASASIAATSIVAPTAAAASTDITVEKNDTLWDLANKHKTTVKDLKEINNLDSDNIQIGQQLKVAENKDTYVVKSGDSLWKIAQANHTSVEELKNINKLTSNTIFVNQKLEIPGIDYVMDTTAVVQKTSDVSTSAQTPVAEEVAPVAEKAAPVAEKAAPVAEKAAPVAEETAPVAEETAPVAEKAAPVAEKAAPVAEETAPVAEETAPAAEEAAPVAEEVDTNASTYEVKAGDSLSKIADLFNTSVNKIAALNELTNSETLSVGQVLAVKGEVKAPTVLETPKETKPVAEEKTEATVNTNASTYKVNAGDTLAVIASQFGTTTSKLVALNNLSNANSLTVGQTLKVKGSVPAPTVTAPKATQTVATQTPSTQTPSTQTPSTQTVAKPSVSASTHTVKSGDSLGKIASQYGVSVSYLVNRNNLSNANDLSVGQVLQLKGAASSSVTPKPTTPKPTTPTTTYKPSKPSAPSTSGLSFNTLFSFAQQFSGTPYVWGGTTPSGFDCSGFTQYVYGNSGVSLNRTAGDQMNQSTKISEGQAKPGDLVFFSYNGGSSIDHVGIYMGNGQMINAQNNGVKIDNIHGNGWGEFLVGFGTVGNFN